MNRNILHTPSTPMNFRPTTAAIGLGINDSQINILRTTRVARNMIDSLVEFENFSTDGTWTRDKTLPRGISTNGGNFLGRNNLTDHMSRFFVVIQFYHSQM